MGVPVVGEVVTFSTWGFRLGRARFVGIGVVDDDVRPHPVTGALVVPLRALDGATEPVPETVKVADIIDRVTPAAD